MPDEMMPEKVTSKLGPCFVAVDAAMPAMDSPALITPESRNLEISTCLPLVNNLDSEKDDLSGPMTDIKNPQAITLSSVIHPGHETANQDDVTLKLKHSPDDTHRLRKRRKRCKNSNNFQVRKEPIEAEEADEWEEDEIASVNAPFSHQPFHRIIFNEDGEACEVVPRRTKSLRVNRRQQKRLATSNYDWSTITTNQPSEGVSSMPLLQPSAAEYAQAFAEPLKVTKNLEVRIHKFPNDYDTVVNYWYTTLEWMDRAAVKMASETAELVDCHNTDVLDELTLALEADFSSGNVAEAKEDIY